MPHGRVIGIRPAGDGGSQSHARASGFPVHEVPAPVVLPPPGAMVRLVIVTTRLHRDWQLEHKGGTPVGAGLFNSREAARRCRQPGMEGGGYLMEASSKPRIPGAG